MTRRYVTVRDLGRTGCDHPRRTGEFAADGYRQTCDDCGADTTDEVEGAAAEAFIRRARGELIH